MITAVYCSTPEVHQISSKVGSGINILYLLTGPIIKWLREPTESWTWISARLPFPVSDRRCTTVPGSSRSLRKSLPLLSTTTVQLSQQCLFNFNKKHLKNVGPIRHCEPPHAHSPDVATDAACAWCLRRRQRRQRRRQLQRVTEGTAMAPWNGPN